MLDREPPLGDETRPPVTLGESAVASLVMFVAAAAVWARHVFEGGFYWADDWYQARLYAFSDGHGLLSNQNAHTSHFSPVLGVLLAIPYRLFGLHTPLHLVLALVLSVAASTAFYVLLRTLGLERQHAGVIAALALFFPWADSSRLWTTGSINNAAVIFFFCGLIASLRGLRARGARARVLALSGTLLYVLAILTYEVVGGVVLLTILVYAWWCPWRLAWRRWILDLAGVVPALAYVWLRQPSHHTDHPSLGRELTHAVQIAHAAATLLFDAVVPGGTPIAIVAEFAIAAAAAVVVWRARGVVLPPRAPSARWSFIAAASVLAIGLAYSPFVPGLEKYIPSAPGLLNRVNLLAAFGYAVLVYALVMLASQLVARALRFEALRPIVASLLCAGILIAYVSGDVQHEGEWDRATRVANRQLDTVARLVPNPRPGTVIYTFGDPNYVAPGVPVFALAGDLTNAVKVRLRSLGADAFPMHPATRWACESAGMYPQDGAFGPRQGARYGRGIFVSIPRGLAVTVESQPECRKWSRRFGELR